MTIVSININKRQKSTKNGINGNKKGNDDRKAQKKGI